MAVAAVREATRHLRGQRLRCNARGAGPCRRLEQVGSSEQGGWELDRGRQQRTGAEGEQQIRGHRTGGQGSAGGCRSSGLSSVCCALQRYCRCGCPGGLNRS